jgi:hypothetical protein
VRRFQCDEQYIEALGRAVFNFALLEHNVIWIIERRLKPGYLSEYISQEKTAGRVAKDFAEAAKGHAEEAELTAFHSVFVDLKNRRNRLLHAKPGTAPSGSSQLYYPTIAWGLHDVRKAATDFADAAEKAARLLWR